MSVDINALLNKAVQMKASDLHIKAGNQPIVRADGQIIPLQDERRLSQEDTLELAQSIMKDYQWEKFERLHDIDIGYSVTGLGRFRCNCFMQRGSVGIVFRIVSMEILDIDELMLPAVLRKISLEPRGLVLVTGTTGSGKSTTLASMVDHINMNITKNIITIEDPIEFLHRDKKSIISQREIGHDTESFSKALRAALRQDPDVILVGEMRDFETIQIALVAAETGHLVLSTLHTSDAVETINRIISVFPPYQHKQVRRQLASVLKAIISMRLVPRADEKGRVPATEVLVATTTIKGCIEDPDKTKLIPEYISEGFSQYGMQTFDQALLGLYQRGIVTYDDAVNRATNPDDFALKVKGVLSTRESWEEGAASKEKNKKGSHIEKFSR